MARVEIIQCDRCKATLEPGELCDSACFIIGDASDKDNSKRAEFPDLCPKCSGAIKRMFNDFTKSKVYPDTELNARGGKAKSEGAQDGGSNTTAETGGEGVADAQPGVEAAGQGVAAGV